MNQGNTYMNKLRTVTVKQVIDDVVQERLAGLLGKGARNAYNDKLSSLKAMGILIKRNSLHERVMR